MIFNIYQHPSRPHIDQSTPIRRVVFHFCVLGNSPSYLPRTRHVWMFPRWRWLLKHFASNQSKVVRKSLSPRIGLKKNDFVGIARCFVATQLHTLVDKEFEIWVFHFFCFFKKRKDHLTIVNHLEDLIWEGQFAALTSIQFSIGYCRGHYITIPNNALLWTNHPTLPYKLAVFDSPNVGNLMTLVIMCNSSFGKV